MNRAVAIIVVAQLLGVSLWFSANFTFGTTLPHGVGAVGAGLD